MEHSDLILDFSTSAVRANLRKLNIGWILLQIVDFDNVINTNIIFFFFLIFLIIGLYDYWGKETNFEYTEKSNLIWYFSNLLSSSDEFSTYYSFNGYTTDQLVNEVRRIKTESNSISQLVHQVYNDHFASSRLVYVQKGHYKHKVGRILFWDYKNNVYNVEFSPSETGGDTAIGYIKPFDMFPFVYNNMWSTSNNDTLRTPDNRSIYKYTIGEATMFNPQTVEIKFAYYKSIYESLKRDIDSGLIINNAENIENLINKTKTASETISVHLDNFFRALNMDDIRNKYEQSDGKNSHIVTVPFNAKMSNILFLSSDMVVFNKSSTSCQDDYFHRYYRDDSVVINKKSLYSILPRCDICEEVIDLAISW